MLMSTFIPIYKNVPNLKKKGFLSTTTFHQVLGLIFSLELALSDHTQPHCPHKGISSINLNVLGLQNYAQMPISILFKYYDLHEWESFPRVLLLKTYKH